MVTCALFACTWITDFISVSVVQIVKLISWHWFFGYDYQLGIAYIMKRRLDFFSFNFVDTFEEVLNFTKCLSGRIFGSNKIEQNLVITVHTSSTFAKYIARSFESHWTSFSPSLKTASTFRKIGRDIFMKTLSMDNLRSLFRLINCFSVSTAFSKTSR